MQPPNDINQDINEIKADFDQLLNLLNSLVSPLHQAHEHFPPEIYAQITQALDETIGQATRAQEDSVGNLQLVTSQDPEARHQGALRAWTAFGRISVQVDYLGATAELAAAGAAGALTHIINQGQAVLNQAYAILGKIGNGIMGLLANHMTLQSWSISGGLKGGAPWLSGSATLGLTFGP